MMDTSADSQTMMDVSTTETKTKTAAQAFFDSNVESSLNFIGIKNGLEPDVDITQQLVRNKQHFSKLKLDYIHLETQQGILENIMQPLEEVESVDDTEKNVHQDKEKLHVILDDTKTVKGQLKTAIRNVKQSWDEFAAQKAILEEMYREDDHTKRAETFAKRAETSNKSCAYGNIDNENLWLDTKEQCETVLEAQKTALMSKQEAFVALSSKAEELEDEVAQQKELLAQLEAKLTHAQMEKASLNRGCNAQATALTNLGRTLQDINGVRVESSSDSVVSFEINTDTDDKVLLHLDVTPDGLVTDIKMNPSIYPQATARLVKRTLQTQNIKSMLTEVSTMVSNIAARKKALTEIAAAVPASGFSMKWSETSEQVIIRSKIHESNSSNMLGLEAHFCIDHAFPCPGSQVMCMLLTTTILPEFENVSPLSSVATSHIQFKLRMNALRDPCCNPATVLDAALTTLMGEIAALGWKVVVFEQAE